MTTTDAQRESPRGARDVEEMAQRTKRAAGDAYSTASDLAGEAAQKAKQAAADTASTVSQQVKQFLDGQVDSGAAMVGHFAGSVKRAANDLDRDAPQLAGLVRAAAGRVDDYARDLRNQPVDQLMRTASDFTRRQPALVFGLAALAGFFALRTLKASPTVSAASPSIQPTYPGD